ncbi:Reverse transcriptase (RNA-dependent DNA polymerase), putative [Entamoeba histolytica]
MSSRWRIRIGYRYKEEIREVKIKNGILQGDSISPLLFILQMNIISDVIDRTNEKRLKVKHVLYMDDIKVTNETKKKGMEMVHKNIIETIEVIEMEVNVSKSGVMKKRNIEIQDNMKDIPIIDSEHQYKYLGVYQFTRNDDLGCIERISKSVEEGIKEINKWNDSSRNYIN